MNISLIGGLGLGIAIAILLPMGLYVWDKRKALKKKLEAFLMTLDNKKRSKEIDEAIEELRKRHEDYKRWLNGSHDSGKSDNSNSS